MSKKIDFAVGGQAVIEGVMMRSPDHVTVAVRRMDNSITVQENKFISLTRRNAIAKLPLVRGVINMFEMMIVGTKALNFATKLQLNDEEEFEKKAKEAQKKGEKEPPRPEFKSKVSTPAEVHTTETRPQPPKSKWAKFAETALFSGSIIFALSLSIFLFKFLPFWTAELSSGASSLVADNYVLFNLIDGVVKLSIFVLYIGLISFIPGISRVFEFHGAEHQAIMTYEKDLELTVENARKQTRFHPRCGTSFILIVFIISVLSYTLFPKADNFWAGFGLRVLILPLIAGVSYEFLKFSAKKQDSSFMQIFIRPGLWLQRLTTREPDDSQLEVALVSLKAALKLERKKRD